MNIARLCILVVNQIKLLVVFAIQKCNVDGFNLIKSKTAKIHFKKFAQTIKNNFKQINIM